MRLDTRGFDACSLGLQSNRFLLSIFLILTGRVTRRLSQGAGRQDRQVENRRPRPAMPRNPFIGKRGAALIKENERKQWRDLRDQPF